MLKELFKLVFLVGGLAAGVAIAIGRHVVAAAVRRPLLIGFLILDIVLIYVTI
jgi:hypothetical protein